MHVWHKKFADLLNIVVMVKTNLTTQAVAPVVLFSSDLDLSYAQLIDYDRLRFQLEFNFRDAKHYWGLEDFMTIKANAGIQQCESLHVHGECLPRRDASHAHAVAGVKCERPESLVP